MSGNGNVKCPVHGEHGVLSDGMCWYCVQLGNSTAPSPKTSTPEDYDQDETPENDDPKDEPEDYDQDETPENDDPKDETVS